MRVLGAMAVVLVMGASALGQSLYEQPVPAPPGRDGAPPASGASVVDGGTLPANGASTGNQQVVAPGPSAPVTGPMPLASVSLTAIEPPKPRVFHENDLITIIISEKSKQDRNQKQDSKKDYDMDLAVTQFIDLLQVLELRSEQISAEHLPKVALSNSTNFKGDGKYKREDTVTDRITAKILEVKPNGTLVLEAKRTITGDEEISAAVLSGICRSEDVTVNNTVQSNQMYDLVFNVQNSGESKRTATKGLIPRVLETLFNF